jgi:hypothetical protein
MYIGGSNSLKRFLQTGVAKAQIVSVIVVREPLSTLLYTVINAATGGKLRQALSRLDYDDAFHLSLRVALKHYGTITIQKNEVLTVSKNSAPLSKESEFIPLSTSNEYKYNTLSGMLSKYVARHGGYDLLNYSGKDRNCQDFVLKAAEILVGDVNPKTRDFIKQDITSALGSQKLRRFMNSVTDLGAFVRRGVYRASSFTPGSILQLSLEEMLSYLHNEDVVNDIVDDKDNGFAGEAPSFPFYRKLYRERMQKYVRGGNHFPQSYLNMSMYSKHIDLDRMMSALNMDDVRDYFEDDDVFTSDYDMPSGSPYAAKDLYDFVHSGDHVHLVPNDEFNRLAGYLQKQGARTRESERIITVVSGA